MSNLNDSGRSAQAGFSDKKLERLARRPFWEKGMALWHAWESERTGFGLGLRVGGFYPPFLPLFIKSDHYANPITEIRENEGAGNQTGAYLTWNPEKAKKMEQAGHKAYCVRHPWRYLNLPRHSSSSGRGTLLFLPHSHSTISTIFDWPQIREELQRIPAQALPITVCIGEQDIHKGLLEEVRENLDLPIVTAGELTSQLFPFRFWSLLKKHRYTAGFNLASQPIYAVWSGRPYLLLNETSFKNQIKNDQGEWRDYSVEENIGKGYVGEASFSEVQIWRESLSKFTELPTPWQLNYVEKYTNSAEAISRLKLFGLLWAQLSRWASRRIR